MSKVEHGKSRKWYDTHCAICGKQFNPKEDRVKGHCVFKKSEEELSFLSCLKCAKTTEIQIAVKQTKEMGHARPEP